MGKIIYTQEFDSVEEQSEFQTATQAQNLKCSLDQIYEMFRKYYKYGHTFKSADEAIEKMMEEMCEIYQRSKYET